MTNNNGLGRYLRSLIVGDVKAGMDTYYVDGPGEHYVERIAPLLSATMNKRCAIDVDYWAAVEAGVSAAVAEIDAPTLSVAVGVIQSEVTASISRLAKDDALVMIRELAEGDRHQEVAADEPAASSNLSDDVPF
jgi:hypothetical protein